MSDQQIPGDRGVAGERGPTGDHGQDGAQGKRGEVGLRGAPGTPAVKAPLTRMQATILAVMALAICTFAGWKVDRNSCQRQEGVRASASLVASTAAKARRADAAMAMRDGKRVEAENYARLAAIYERAAAEAHPLECSGLLPDTR